MRPPRRLLGLLVLLGVLGGALGYALNSERGLHWAFRVLARAVPGELRAAQLHGRLLGPIRVTALEYRAPGVTITIGTAVLEWRPRALLTGRLDVTRLRIADVTIAGQARRNAQHRTAYPAVQLPLRLRLDDAQIDRLSVQSAGAEQPLAIETIQLRGEVGAKTVRVSALRMQASAWSASVSGTVTPAPPYQMHLDTQWRVKLSQRANFQGAGQLVGDVRQLAVRQGLSAPFHAEVQASLTDLLTDLHWQGAVQFERMNLNDVVPSVRPLTLAGEAHGQGSLADFSATGKLQVHDATLGIVDATLALSRADHLWRVDRLEASVAGTPTRLALHGSLDQAASNNFSLDATWQALRWPLHGAAKIDSAQGSASIKGLPKQYRVKFSGDLTVAGTPLGQWHADGEGTQEALQLTTLEGNPLGGRVEATGRLDWRPTLRWSLALHGRGLDPEHRWPAWQGKLAVDLNHSGTLAHGRLTTDTRLARLHGVLRGQTLEAKLGLRTDGARLQLSDAEITDGGARFSASGEVNEHWSLRWALSAPDLGAVLPDGHGNLAATGGLSGPRERPGLVANIHGEQLAWRGYAAAQFSADAALDLSDGKSSDLRIEARQLRLQQDTLDELSISAEGRVAQHRVAIAVLSADAQLRLSIAGGLAQGHWRGQLTRMQLDSRQFGHWTLAGAGRVEVSSDGIEVARNCFAATPAAVCLHGAWRRGAAWHGALDLQELPLALLDPWLPPDLHITGVVNGAATLSGSPQSRGADVQLAFPGGALLYAFNAHTPQVLQYRDGSVRFNTTGGALHGTLQLSLAGDGRLRGELTLPQFAARSVAWPAQPLLGALDMENIDLQWLPVVFPELSKASGQLHAGLKIGGTIGKAALAGQLTVANADVEVPRLGLHLHQLTLDVHNTSATQLVFDGRVTSGAGTLQLHGQAATDVLQGGAAMLTLEGEQVTVADVPEAKVVASPKLALRIDRYQMHLSGEVRIPQGRLEPAKYKAPVAASPDVVIVGAAQAPEPRSRWQLHTRVQIVLGDAVSFQGFGLTGKLAGALIAIDEPGKATIGEGEIRVTEGKYKIYGRELDVEQGRLLFAGGPIANPNIDARAARHIGDIVAGVRVQGPLDAPEVSLYSDPTMDQSDILSYLVVGRPLSSASKSEGNLLYTAATSLGLQGSGLIAQRIGSTFGIQDVRIATDTTTQQPALVLGTYLSPRVYVAYSVGLFQPSHVLQFRFHLTPHWQLQTESGAGSSGADLLYSIER